ncbi:cell cycle checkpoint protein RAD1-like [Penaeus japonicus]|uniref:cell cycle checkpoint protein RAD1-like n=1 Tax=Penaeus japonicus TaxID=27405 RepID=UPI001C70E4CF|nr:cell cycle checkpoint protein RAD1-like [Penaeus japonicus]
MSFSSQLDDEHNDYQLMTKIDNAKNVLHLLKAVNFRDTATVFASSNGLKVTVEEAKCIQANAFIQSDMFQEYNIQEDMITFKVNLNVFVECLNIFGGSSTPGITPALKMCYNGYGSPLILLLEEAGVLTDCSIRTQEADDTLDFNFCNTGVINKVIMRSECLKEVFSELDMSSDVLEILMSPDPPYFRLSTFGNYGTNHTDIPRDSDMVENFTCTQTMIQRYKLSLLRPSIKPLSASQKVSVRTDERGFLCLQFMIKTEDNHICFVEFFCCPEEEGSD